MEAVNRPRMLMPYTITQGTMKPQRLETLKCMLEKHGFSLVQSLAVTIAVFASCSLALCYIRLFDKLQALPFYNNAQCVQKSNFCRIISIEISSMDVLAEEGLV